MFRVLGMYNFGLHLEKKLGLYYKSEKNPGDKLKKKSRFADLDFSRLCRLKGRFVGGEIVY